jgi:serine/threonine protein kinase
VARALACGRLEAPGPDGAPIDSVYMIEELVPGVVADVWAPGQSTEHILEVGAQIAAALAALHEAGVVHCDVKPENLFVLSDRAWGTLPQVKVIDFGVSRRVNEVLEEGVIAGTPWCMAPEQWHGRPLPASDVYALGCLLYDLVTGSAPFDGSLPALMTAYLEQRPARPSWLAAMPIELERIILRALAKAPEDRPAMAEMARELTRIADALVPVTASARVA